MFSKLKLASSEEKKHKIIAHRGMSGKYPENTVLAFEAARLLGLRWIETDINMLGDEREYPIIILSHTCHTEIDET
jgi:glycerophosphoryl diester phosphodiesterase